MIFGDDAGEYPNAIGEVIPNLSQCGGGLSTTKNEIGLDQQNFMNSHVDGQVDGDRVDNQNQDEYNLRSAVEKQMIENIPVPMESENEAHAYQAYQPEVATGYFGLPYLTNCNLFILLMIILVVLAVYFFMKRRQVEVVETF